MQGGRKRLQHCKGSLVGRCQKHDKNVWSQPSWSTKWKGPKYLALIMLVLLLTLIDSKWHVEERQTWLSSDLVDIDRLRMTLGWSEWLCDIDRQWLCPEVKCKEEWHVVILSLLISFLTWNVKRIQDTLLPKWNAKKEWHVVILSFSTSFLTWNVNGIQDTLFPKWKWKDWYSQY